MKNKLKRLMRKIKILEKEKERADKELSELLYPLGIFRILKRSVRERTGNLQKLSHLLEAEIKDLNEDLLYKKLAKTKKGSKNDN